MVNISKDDLCSVNIDTALNCLVKASVKPKKEEKIKNLILASKLIEQTLINYGVNVYEFEIKKSSIKKTKS
jgi:hypothetical protein